MKKKPEIVSLLDELRSEDSKKRLNSVMSLKEIAAAIGPARVRTEFIQYLAEFIDDEQNIVLQLLNQLSDFAPLLGGEEHEKVLLPLLIGFCKTDERKEAERATDIIIRIMPRHKELIYEVVKKLNKVDMRTSKEAAARIISSLVHLVPQHESQLLEIYSNLLSSEVPSNKIIAAQYLDQLLKAIKNKEEVGKFLDLIYNDAEDLPKIFALKALFNFYAVNSAQSASKVKALLAVNSWRVNMKICENISLAASVFSKKDFKALFEAQLIKMLSSSEPELRCRACCVLKSLTESLSEEEVRTKLMPLIKKLSQDSVDYVKVEVSKNIVSLLEVCSQSVIKEDVLPVVFSFIKNNEFAIGIVEQFSALVKKVSPEVIEDKIMGPLVSQFSTDNWRVKCQLITLLGNVVSNAAFLNDQLTSLLVSLTADRINAVREKALDLIVSIINQQPPQWTDSMFIPKLKKLRDSESYIERQYMLLIIEKTADKVSEKTLNDIYKVTVAHSLNDKIPNVRARALKIVRSNKKLSDKSAEKLIEKLKTDTDLEVRELATAVKA